MGRAALHQHLSRAGPQHAVDQVDQGALAAAVGAHDADEVTRPARERDVPQHRLLLVSKVDIAQRQDVHAVFPGLSAVLPAAHVVLPAGRAAFRPAAHAVFLPRRSR